MTRRACLASALAVLALPAGCDSTGPGELERVRLDLAVSRWESAAVDAYEYLYRPWCLECRPSPDIRIRVVGGVVVEAGDATGIEALPEGFVPPSIADLFGRVAGALDSGRYALNVTYDREFGYPRLASFGGTDPSIMDDGYGFSAWDLVPLP